MKRALFFAILLIMPLFVHAALYDSSVESNIYNLLADAERISSLASQLADHPSIVVEGRGMNQTVWQSQTKHFNVSRPNEIIKQIEFDGVRSNASNKILFDSDVINHADQSYAIDTSSLDFINGTIHIIAKGNALYKCPTWNFTARTCESVCTAVGNETTCAPPWQRVKDITPGQEYSLEIGPNDPGFYETSESADLAFAPLTNTTFAVAFVNRNASNITLSILNTTGNITSTKTVDSNVDNASRVDISALNTTHFVVAWVAGKAGSADFIYYQIYLNNGTNTTAIINTTQNIGAAASSNYDIGIAELGDRFAICDANNNNNRAEARVYFNNGTAVAALQLLDNNIGPAATTLQNLIDCSAASATNFTTTWYDASGGNNVRFVTESSTGAISIGQTTIGTTVGTAAQVATASASGNFLYSWYNSAGTNVTMVIRNLTNAVVVGPTAVDTNAGASSRVAAGTVERNQTNNEELFVVAWQDGNSADIKAAVYNRTGNQATAPFTVTTTPSATNLILDVFGKQLQTSQEICPGRFIVGFSNSSGKSEFRGFLVNGSTWDGNCPDIFAPKVSIVTPVNGTTINQSTLLVIRVNVTDQFTIDKVVANVSLPTTGISVLNLTFNATSGYYEGTFTNTSIIGQYNITIIANDTSGNVNNTVKGYFVSLDATIPTVNAPANQNVDVGSATTIPWLITDPAHTFGNYTVTTNGTFFTFGSWTNNTQVLVTPNTNFIGLYNYTIYYNNNASLNGTPGSVRINVTDQTPATCSNYTPDGQGPTQSNIIINGDFSDWALVLNNPTNYMIDGAAGFGDLDNPGTADRDVVEFAYTYNSTYVFFYYRRVSTGNNQNSPLVYIDLDRDGYMNATDKVLKFTWTGSNALYDSTIWDYVPANISGGDLMLGDGHTLQGTIASSVAIESNMPGGSNPGITLETRVPWTVLGSSTPISFKMQGGFAQGAGTNLPSQVQDNINVMNTANPQILFTTSQTKYALNGTNVSYTLQIGSCGNLNTLINLANVSSQNYTIAYFYINGTQVTDTTGDGLPDVFLPAQNATKIIAVILIPANATAGTTDISTSTALPIGINQSKSLTLTSIVGAISLLPKLIIRSVIPGAISSGTYTVKNLQSVTDTIKINVTSSQGYAINLTYQNGTVVNDTNADGYLDLGSFVGGQEKNIVVNVTVPPSATFGTVDVTNITINSTVIPTLSTQSQLQTTVNPPISIQISPSVNSSGGPATSVFYTLTITNSGSAATSVEFNFTRVLNFTTLFYDGSLNPLTDTNGNGLVNTVNISSYGGTTTVIVEVQIPSTAVQNTTEITTINATSFINPANGQVVTLRTTVQSLETYQNAPRTVQQSVFEIGDTVYARAFGLNQVNNVYFQWIAPNLSVVRISPSIPVTSALDADDQLVSNSSMDLGNYTVAVFKTQNNVQISYRNFILRDTQRPKVVLVSPIAGSNYNVSNQVNLSANITDNYRLNVTTVTIVYPNGTQVTLNLTNVSNRFNATFVVPDLQGQYNVTFFSNDSSNNINNSITTTFFGRGPPKVVVVSPTGGNYTLNVTVSILANITDFEPISSQYVNITYPNGTIFTFNLTQNGTIYGLNFSDFALRGRYNITFFANDTLNYVNATSTTFFTRIALNVIDVINLSNYAYLNYTIQVTSNISNVLNLTVNISGKRVKQINLTNHNDTSPYSILRVDDENPYVAGEDFAYYSIDPSGINFVASTVDVNATGTGVLYKCSNYDSSAQDCNGAWLAFKNITKGQVYQFAMNATDPGFLETSAAVDVALAPINDTGMIVAFANQTQIGFSIYNTNGTRNVGPITVDSTGDTTSRVDVSMLNSTTFVFAWIDGPSTTASWQLYKVDGTNVSGRKDINTTVGTNTDISSATLGDRFVICYANDGNGEADFQIFSNGGSQLVNQTTVDSNMNPSSTLQNLVDCTGVNSTRFAYTWFDRVGNRAKYFIFNQSGGNQTAEKLLGGAGKAGQVAVADLNNNSFAVIWYDRAGQNVNLDMRGVNDSTVLSTTAIDSAAGTDSRVAAGTARQNDTATDDLLLTAWYSQGNSSIKAAVYNSTGGMFTAPFIVESQPNTTFQLIDIMGRDSVENFTICPGTFAIAYTNSSGQGVFKTYYVNGTLWDGRCGTDLVAINVSSNETNPAESHTISVNGTVLNNGTSAATNFNISLKVGTCGNGTTLNATTVTVLIGGANITVNATWTTTAPGPFNLSLCADDTNVVIETDESNNNLSTLINVKAYQDYYGKLIGNLTLDTRTNNSLYDWNFTDGGNVYFTDSDQTINFSRLLPLGRNTTFGVTANDFSDIDTALNMTAFNDSIQTLWALNASTPRQTTNFTVRGRTIPFVPIINSTNSSAFITGILWDPTNDTNGQYDPVDKEPLVFIGNINRSTPGFYGTYDYEVHVPVLLRSYVNTSSNLSYFIELR